eukprot:3591174-Prorocentrum_lima.AAC.1
MPGTRPRNRASCRTQSGQSKRPCRALSRVVSAPGPCLVPGPRPRSRTSSRTCCTSIRGHESSLLGF